MSQIRQDGLDTAQLRWLKLKNNQSLMTKRLATYLADGIYDILEEWAKDERRSVSSLSAFILEQAARERQKEMKQQPPPSDEKQEKS